MMTTESLSLHVGVRPACSCLVVSRSGFYRWKNGYPSGNHVRLVPPLSLSGIERQNVLDVLHDGRFVDKAPHEVYAALLDEGEYLCSARTMYRILEANNEVKERRDQLGIRFMQSPNCLPKNPIRSGHGTSQKSRGL